MTAGSKAGKTRNTILGAIFLIMMLVVFVAAFRTTILEFSGKIVLNAYGFNEVSLTIDAVGTDKIRVDQLSLSKQIKLYNITVEYRLLSLLSGQIDQIDIGELFLDISDPARGALARILEIAGDEDGENTAATELRYPKVELQKGTIVAENVDFSFSASLSGSLSSDLELKTQSILSAHIDAAAGPVLLENMQLSAEVDVAAQTASLELTDGLLRHDVETPDWAPLSLSGSGHLTDGNAEIQVTLRTSEGKSLARLQGSYETEAEKGEIQASLVALSFRRDGFQPSDLSRYAQSLPVFDGTLDLTANAKIAGSVIAYKADITLDKLHMELDDGKVVAERLPLGIRGEYCLDDGTQDAQIAFSKSNAVLTYAGQKYDIKDLAASLNIVNLAEKVELTSFSGSVLHKAANAYFSPLSFNASGEMSNLQEIALNGSVRDGSGKFALDIAAEYLIDSGSGNVSFHLPATKIGAGGIALSDLSSVLKPMDGLSGTVTGEVEIVQGNEGNFIISSAHAALAEGSWEDENIKISGVALDISAAQGDNNEPLQGNISGQADTTRLKGQSANIPSLEASFEIAHDSLKSLENGLLTLSNLTIVPDEGALFKETQTITGTGRIKDNDLDILLNVKTVLLGSYLDITGQHSLSADAGSAKINMKPLSFVKGGLQLTDLAVFEVDLTLDGRIVPDAKINWSADGLKSTADMTLEDLSIDIAGGSVADLNGEIHIDELFPLTISAPQEVTAASAVAGIPLDKPLIRFRVLTEAGAPQLHIDRISLGLVGGTAVIDGAVIDTGGETNRIEVQLTRLDLEEVMALSNVEELVATGEVSGRVPLVFGGDRLIVDEALLSADGPGVLKMTSDAARRALEGGGNQAKLLLDILENFQYSELSIEIMKTQSGEDTVKLHAAGANPNVEDNRPVILNINLTTSLDKIFNTLLQGYLLSEKALRATVDGR